MKIQKKKKIGGGGGGGGRVGGGVRVDVIEELKFLGKLKKKQILGGGGLGRGGGGGALLTVYLYMLESQFGEEGFWPRDSSYIDCPEMCRGS